ncbi:putative protein isoform X1 [Capsicum galapagoense]
MSHYIQISSLEVTSIDNQIPLLLPTEKDEIEEGREVDHLSGINETNGQDSSGSQPREIVNRISGMFKGLDNSSLKSCIFKVNVGLRESNPGAYTPKMVSIGPYHRKNPMLRPMEKYKVLYLQRFLKRQEGLDLESCINELEELKEEALKCYDDIEDLKKDTSHTDQFLQMLLLDGCFVVEFIRELHKVYPPEEEKIIDTSVGYIFDQLTRDLMLLENQLPFFVLNKLHHMTKKDDELPFAIMAKCCFAINLPKTTPAALLEIHNNANAGKIKHLLHLIHMSWQGNPNTDPTYSWRILCCNPLQIIRSKEKKNDKGNKINKVIIPNATELSEAGLSFKSFGNIYRSLDKDDDIGDTSLFDIKYENGLLKIPCLRLFDSTESNLRNLIAFEQQSDVHHRYFSDYATFMDQLIESDKDVNLLRQKGIIINGLGEDKEVTRFFNKIGKGVSTSAVFYDKQGYRKIIEHCERPWNRMKANLIHNYFSSPWVGASTLAAIVLLILTAIQTVLAFTGGVK